MTTTDPFVDAATASYEDYIRQPRMNVGTVRDRIAEAHIDGWHAARDYLAAQEPDEYEVEATAIALYNDDESWGFVVEFAYGTQAADWGDLGPGPQQMFRDFARRALSAARRARGEDPTR